MKAIFLVLVLVLAACDSGMSRFMVGDCIEYIHGEEWEKRGSHVKILAVGKYHYRTSKHWWNEGLEGSFADLYHKVPCTEEDEQVRP